MDFAKAIDVTLPLRPAMPLYPGDQPPRLWRRVSRVDGDVLTNSELTIGCHVGTHVDAPAHFLAKAATVDKLPRKHFFGHAWVADLVRVQHVTEADIRTARIPRDQHIILKTRNTFLWAEHRTFTPDYCHVSVEAVARLLELKPLSIGIDYYSLDPVSESAFPAHRLVAEAGLPVFVCLDLRRVTAAAPYQFAAFGLPLAGAEAVQVRAFLARPIPT
ncbi:MAG TPA: cyclase family protein [Rhodopila sp.]|uniref:cyclase family protein n=1 Tax=Rhodopila sp. TaxID=2480087 RepID=UPI002C191535|nr:cyclase family protein [Rhodopila sp.]HVY17166.1 cyclase family protein [Rhodopila sp.]